MVNSLGASSGCDYDFNSYGSADSNEYTDVYDRTLFVGWSKPVLIRSIRIAAMKNNCKCTADLYVTSSKNFLLEDSRTLCQSNINAEGDGIWNCPSVLKGNYLAVMTKQGCDIKKWMIAEIRAWSRKDIANSAVLLQNGEILSAS